jgi:four helix bundle suffix protein
MKTTDKVDSYRTLGVYQKSVCVFDVTYVFVDRFLDRAHDRTADQMQQAARSCKQNIVEGYSDAEGSSDSYLKLTVIAKGSLEELKEDYLDYLRVHHLTRWDQHHPKYEICREYFKRHNDSAWYQREVEHRNAEEVANIALILIYQTLALLRGYINYIDRKFLTEGGVKEQRFRARQEYRKQQMQGSRYRGDSPNEQNRFSGGSPCSGNAPTTPTKPTEPTTPKEQSGFRMCGRFSGERPTAPTTHNTPTKPTPTTTPNDQNTTK